MLSRRGKKVNSSVKQEREEVGTEELNRGLIRRGKKRC